MGNDYIFFDLELRDRFVQGLSARGLTSSAHDDAMEGFVVALDTDPGDDLLDEIEEMYDALMQEQMLLAEQRSDWGSHQVASLQIARADGSEAEVRLPPAVARKLLAHYSIDEARDLVSAIAHSLENPVDGPLCRRDLLRTSQT
ncbi:MAG: hypothetical protein OEY75_03235 [Hylemonella sp.]|nr:hypothetical protein [Hylemonella sp.]